MLPLRPGLPARQTTTTKRNGTTTLFAALEVATGKIIADGLLSPAPAPAAHPAVELHIVADNYATHKHPRSPHPLPAVCLDQDFRGHPHKSRQAAPPANMNSDGRAATPQTHPPAGSSNDKAAIVTLH